MQTAATDALEQHFGFREFLDGQEPVVSALLEGRDALVVMPTGGGKSLCYQLPAMVKDGITIVVSPLIALMKDQVDALLKRNVPAAMINSTLSLQEQQERLQWLREGSLKLVYIAPERFRSRSFRNALQGIPIALFAVDEAHCLSQWGHDFRPDYLRLGQAVEELGRPQTAAFTATATPQVREDIQNTLNLRDPFVTVTGFERPNLSLCVTQVASMKEKIERLEKIIRQWKTGIVYCATRKRVKEVHERLQSFGYKAIAYHGGLEDREREMAQNAFIDRTFDVAVATNAFGMGIDRSDVRFVVHMDVPGSLEAYYQEAGRAGRDREPAWCELLFNYADTATQEFFIEGSNPGSDVIRSTWGALMSQADEQHEVKVTIKELSEWTCAKNDMAVSTAISVLSRAKYIERFDIPGSRMRGSRLLQPQLSPDDLELDEEGLARKEASDRQKLKSMVEFCYADICRQVWILEYFGETEAVECGSCDQCSAQSNETNRPPDAEEKLVVQKALSGVARMSWRNGKSWRGRYGKGKIVNMLVGSKAADILDKKLDQLSTYGLLKKEGPPYVFALFKELERTGLVVTERGEYPVMTLTPRGSRVMRGEDEFQLAWPDKSRLTHQKKSRTSGGKAPTELPEDKGLDTALLERLKQTRSEVAAAEGGKPLYAIFSNDTLEAFARYRPQSMEEGMSIKGVGEHKARTYLEDFLEVIRDWERPGCR